MLRNEMITVTMKGTAIVGTSTFFPVVAWYWISRASTAGCSLKVNNIAKNTKLRAAWKRLRPFKKITVN